MTDSKEDSFSRLYAMGHTNFIAQQVLENTAKGIFHLFMSLGMPPPVFRIAENDQLSQKVTKILYELYQKSGLPSKTQGPQPIVVLLDRFQDLHTMIHH
jgi:hypothetical protein